MAARILDVKVDKITKLDGNGKLKAFCDLLFGGLFLVKGFRIVEGEDGRFVGMPQQLSKQGKWFNVFLPATNEVREYLKEVILQAYENEE